MSTTVPYRTREILVQNPLGDWRLGVGELTYDDQVWFYLNAGPMSGGTFMSRDQARALADMLQRAASETLHEAALRHEREGKVFE